MQRILVFAVVLMTIALAGASAQSAIQLIGTLPNGNGAFELAYRPGFAGPGPGPSDIWVNEDEGFLAVLDISNGKIKRFKLEGFALIDSSPLPFFIETRCAFVACAGAYFLNDSGIVRAYDYSGKELASFKAASTTSTDVVPCRAIAFAVDAEGTVLEYRSGKFTPVSDVVSRSELEQRIIGKLRHYSGGARDYAKYIDYEGRRLAITEKGYIVDEYWPGGALKTETLILSKEAIRTTPQFSAFSRYLVLEQMAGSGTVYFATMTRLGFSLYRVVPPYLK